MRNPSNTSSKKQTIEVYSLFAYSKTISICMYKICRKCTTHSGITSETLPMNPLHLNYTERVVKKFTGAQTCNVAFLGTRKKLLLISSVRLANTVDITWIANDSQTPTTYGVCVCSIPVSLPVTYNIVTVYSAQWPS